MRVREGDLIDFKVFSPGQRWRWRGGYIKFDLIVEVEFPDQKTVNLKIVHMYYNPSNTDYIGKIYPIRHEDKYLCYIGILELLDGQEAPT